MAHERRRAALAALCVFAVAFAATLLPASGFGSQPAGVGVSGDGPDAPVSGDTGPDDSGSTSKQNPQTSTNESSMSATASGSDEDSAPTETTATDEATTTTARETTTEAASSVGDVLRGLFAPIVLTALGLVGLVVLVGFGTGALAVSSATAGALPFTLVVGGTPIGELVGAIPTRTMAFVVGLSASIPRLLDDAAALTGEVGRSAGTLVVGLARGTGQALRVGAQGLAVTFAAIPRALAGLGAGAGILSSLGSVSVPSLGRGGNENDSGRSGPSGDTAEPDETGPPSVEEAWETMRDRVPVRNRDARTPGEVARTAAKKGYPDEAVRRLTDAFREVRYGDLPRDDRTDSARSALDRLRDFWRDEK
ncbi:DUF4129 domain-containing protein [Halorussus lipolyticus]|uniref:DUF4129 domain-containing protein n=1 Tax=Halorussus lipolyticus TaxID=3034024 RepID=UPI0023E8D4D6|nr:DUF4129 domain-containing protein [Halorussus sp. DT80]